MTMTRRMFAVAGLAAVGLAGCGEGRKPAAEPMKTEGPNQYVFAVPGMT